MRALLSKLEEPTCRTATSSKPAHRGIRIQLAEAHAIAKVAVTCAGDGQIDRALAISLDIEELIHSANHFLRGCSYLEQECEEEREEAKD